MKTISLFYQGEGIAELAHIELPPEATFAVLKAQLISKHGIASDALLFLEDAEDHLDESILIKDRATAKGCKVHIHRCRQVLVRVTFNGGTVDHRFAPGATVNRIKRWAAEHKFGMSDAEAGEHVLQLAGTHVRPAPGTHIGALTDGKLCSVAFDLVPNERINGASRVSP